MLAAGLVSGNTFRLMNVISLC